MWTRVSRLEHVKPRCFTVLDVYNSIRDAANLPPIIDGRHSLMLQERWEGSVLASILAFFFAIWTVRSMHWRGVHFLSFLELRDLVLVSLQCPWLVRCCPTRSHKQRRQDRVCSPLPTPGVTIYRSDGACRSQGTIAGWSAAVWSADARGLGAGRAFATARGFLEMIIPTIKLNILLFFSVCFARYVCTTLTLFLKWTL